MLQSGDYNGVLEGGVLYRSSLPAYPLPARPGSQHATTQAGGQGGQGGSGGRQETRLSNDQ